MDFADKPVMKSVNADGKLGQYKAKRNFSRSPEPSGQKRGKKPGRQAVFYIQKHDATRLHYDFRLEVDGVLVSWALPKGPPLERDHRRLAVKVEDHPLDYGDFEGVIPHGEYGAGSVMLWDRGSYENLRQEKTSGQASMADSIDEGLVEVRLHGERLKGPFALKRFKEESGKEQWLMLMMRGADSIEQPELLEQEDCSVKTGRTMEEIAHDG